jgi:hypothetical protein
MWPRKRLNRRRPERTSGRCSSRPRAGFSARLCSSPMAARQAARPRSGKATSARAAAAHALALARAPQTEPGAGLQCIRPL